MTENIYRTNKVASVDGTWFEIKPARLLIAAVRISINLLAYIADMEENLTETSC